MGQPFYAPVHQRADIELLAQADEAHETLSGPATLKILYREYHDFADLREAGIQIERYLYPAE